MRTSSSNEYAAEAGSGRAGTPADVAARIERMPLSSWHGRLIGTLGAAHLFDVFDATALAFALPVLVVLWGLSPTETGLLLASGYVGQLVGAVGLGLLAGRYGRISTLRASLIILAGMSLLCAFAPSYFVLLLLRIIQGVGLGGETPIAATYMNEVSPARYRGKMIVAIQLMAAAGALTASIAGFLLIPRYGWSSLFFVGTIPIVLGFALRHLLPESPRWLAARGRYDDADSALRRIEVAVFKNRLVRPTGPAVVPASEVALQANPRETISALLTPQLRRATVSAWIMAFCSSIVGYGLIGWMPTIYRTVYHLPLSTTLAYSVASGLVSLLGATCGMFLIDWIGRKPALVGGFAASAVFLAMLVLLGDRISPFQVMILASLSLTALGLPLSGLYVYAPELYPTSLRSLGTGVASAWLRVASIIGPPVIGLLLEAASVYGVYLALCITAAVGAAAMVCLGVETAPHLAAKVIEDDETQAA